MRFPRSIVFRTAFYSAALCGVFCVIVFAFLFQMQRRIYENRLITESEETIVRISETVLGYFYAQGNWVYMEDQQRRFNKAPNILYNYFVNMDGKIDLGIDGPRSPDNGQAKQTWEPVLPPPSSAEPARVSFTADDELARLYPGRISAGDKLVLISAPISCLTVREACGQLRVAIAFESIATTLQQLRTTLIASATLLSLATALIVFLTTRRNLMPIRIISEKMRDLAQQASPAVAEGTVTGDLVSDELKRTSSREAEETRFFRESLGQFTTAFKRTSVLENELTTSRSLSDLAAQVAHDIRSPLAALEIVSSSLSQLPEDRRIMLRSALSRIRDIANNLLSDNQPHLRRLNISAEPVGTESLLAAEASVYLLASLVDILLSEKRIQFRARIGVHIEGKLASEAYGLFVKLPAVAFKRVLSNVINNAVESIIGDGQVNISVRSEANVALIRISDTGGGIPPELLPKLMNKGFSFGKRNGLGLGLYHAKTAVEAWGGTISILSTVGEGSEVTLCLPRVSPPVWFVPEVRILPDSIIVVLDDDSSIHQVWQGRFETLPRDRVEVLHFSMPEEMLEWHARREHDVRPILYLMDYEFIGSDTSGIDIIKRLNLAAETILVTSRFEESTVLEECRNLHIRLIPKGQAGFVPLEYEATRPQPDAILIDDDPLVRDGWSARARQRGKIISVFESVAQFREVWGDYAPGVPIFVDSSLGTELKGEDFALELHGRGFTELYLATGYPASYFEPMAWLRGVVSKAPPDWL